MNKNKPALLPKGTILTTEGKDKILTGKLQREVVLGLVNFLEPNPTLAELTAWMCNTAPQNVHRTVKALEAKGVLKAIKGVKGEVTLHHCLGKDSTGNFTIDYTPRELEDAYGATPGDPIVGNHDFVAAIVDAWEGRQSEVFKTGKPARPDETRWYIVTFNKPALYKLAAHQFQLRVDLEAALDALSYGQTLTPLAEQAARGAWQPFFDTLKKNRVISYHEIKGEGRVMIWDNRRWAVYSTRVMKERQEMLNAWGDKTAMREENARLAAEANAEFRRRFDERIAELMASASPERPPL